MKNEKVKSTPITANEFLNIALGGNMNISTLTPLAVTEIMVEFAKIHVKEALQKASEKFDAECNKNVILMCYPIDKIL